MLTQLSTLKTRLAIDQFDLQYDAILTNAIRAVSARFDKECSRTLTRTVGLAEEFSADETEIRPACYPIETVTKFELKSNETEGWIEQTNVDFLIRRACVVSLSSPFALRTFRFALPQARVTYTGGYVMPGTTPGAGQAALPDDLEQAAVEQAAYWFQDRDKLGLIRNRPDKGTYQQFAQLDLLLNVKAVLQRHERWRM
jgi:hypothetical protein